MDNRSPVGERAVSFGSVASDYDRFRPPPPVEVARWLVPDPAATVADVCAGTGGFTRSVAQVAPTVAAVELDARMLAVLRARSPDQPAVRANGQVLPFRDGALDAVVVSSAWHWLDPTVAVPEVARVLRPGGVLGVVWGGPDPRVDWVAGLRSRALGGGRRRGRWELNLPTGGPFMDPEHTVITWTLERTPEQMIGWASTYSVVITADDQLRARAERDVAENVAALTAGRPTIEVPMAARCYRAVKKG